MIAKVLKPVVYLAILVVFVSAACMSGGGSTPAPTEAPQPTQEEQAPQPPEPTQEVAAPTEDTASTEDTSSASSSGAVSTLQQVRDATIQIEAQGSFVDPEFGAVFNSAGRGSGFIIDPSGIAVTNNHVVTGAGLLKVWIGGDDSKTYNAKILGVSECSDLAVIDIEGDGFPYLEWYDGAIDVGTDMYIAGFPLGDPEYSLTKGVISRARADGKTSWSSVESVIEYDATSNPGNSGGPVVDAEGNVLAVHYMGNSQTRQAWGISRDAAVDVVEELRTGKNVDSIGVNGSAVANEDGSLTGIWVSSVQSGSPADKAGVSPGDIIITMENLVLATDYTMADYCDILRSHDPGDTLSIEVLRWATGEMLNGQLNGRELAVASTFDSSTSTESATEGTSSSGVVNLDASQPGEFYYDTEFDAGVGDWVYFLTSGEESGFTYATEESRLRFEIDQDQTWIYFLYDPYDFTDVRVDTSAENLGLNNNNVSLICRYSDEGWYEFNIANNGEWTILRWDPVTNSYVTIYTGGSTLIKTGRNTNTYTAICQGDQLTLGVNGVEVRTVRDTILKSGRAGLSVSSFNVTPIIVEFDYFTISVP